MIGLSGVRYALSRRHPTRLLPIVLGSLVLLGPVVALALADSPWVRGVCDGGDYDDLAFPALPAAMLSTCAPFVVGSVVLPASEGVAARSTRRFPPRAPPLS